MVTSRSFKNFNRLEITGEIAGRPRLFFTPKGLPVLKIVLAVNLVANKSASPNLAHIGVLLKGDKAIRGREDFRQGQTVYCKGRLDFKRWGKEGNAPAGAWLIVAHYIGAAMPLDQPELQLDNGPEERSPAERQE